MITSERPAGLDCRGAEVDSVAEAEVREREHPKQDAAASRPLVAELRRSLAEIGAWPLHVKAMAAVIAVLFAPVLWETAELWLTDDSFAHGVFIFPVALFLLWMERDALRAASARASAWGLAPLAIGLLLETASYLARVRFLAIAALVPVLAGAVLILHGRDLWRKVCFPVCFLLFSVPIPGFLLASPSHWIQNVSSTGAAGAMRLLGYPILQTGNIIQIPGMSLEVADVCSGFKKLFALFAFSLLYGYVFKLSLWRRVLLTLTVIPIAVAANVVRVAGLIGVSAAGGMRALHAAHDWAELFVIVAAFGLFVMVGKALGCKNLRFYPSVD